MQKAVTASLSIMLDAQKAIFLVKWFFQKKFTFLFKKYCGKNIKAENTISLNVSNRKDCGGTRLDITGAWINDTWSVQTHNHSL